jgi:hypothetical protein
VVVVVVERLKGPLLFQHFKRFKFVHVYNNFVYIYIFNLNINVFNVNYISYNMYMQSVRHHHVHVIVVIDQFCFGIALYFIDQFFGCR